MQFLGLELGFCPTLHINYPNAQTVHLGFVPLVELKQILNPQFIKVAITFILNNKNIE